LFTSRAHLESSRLRGLLKACPDCTKTTMENAALVHRCILFFMLRDRLGKEIVASACDPDVSDLAYSGCALDSAE
jgi:hypothetical protein